MIRVTRSTIIDAPIEQVWSVLRDFNSHIAWHPIVAQSVIEGDEPADRVGCVRRFTLRDGARVREQLLALSDREYRCTYCILEADVPLERYVATVQLKPVTDGRRTFWHWQSIFRTPRGRERELAELVGRDVYEGGFTGLAHYLAHGEVPGRAGPRPGQTLAATAIVLQATGEPEVLVARTVSVPPPGPGEVRIAHRAIGVNYLDVYIRRGLVPLASPGQPLGVEAAGVVLDIGSEVTAFKPGDRVAYAMLPPGSYATHRNVPANQLVRVPAHVSDETAAAVLLKGLTAEYLLHRLHPLRPRETVLVHAAAGGLGGIVVQWARALGAVVIGTVSSEEKAQEARRHGCHDVVVTSDYNFSSGVLSATGGRGVDLIVDGLGVQGVQGNLASLAVLGHWVSVGQASGALPPLSADALIEKSATFSRPVLFHYTADPQRLAEMAGRLWSMLASGKVRATIGARYPLAAAADAHRALEARITRGSQILVP
jgi:NADPH:quinone reductase-like Zn-dependent oxidoreductase